MKHQPKSFISKILLVTLFLQTSFPSLQAKTSSQASSAPLHNEKLPPVNYIKIENPYFTSFVESIVEEAQDQETSDHLPPCLLRCYEQLHQGNQEVSKNDLQEALPTLLSCLATRLQLLRAPRPVPGLHSAAVGPLICNVHELENLISELQQTVLDCCSNITVDFDITFSFLVDILESITACCNDLTVTVTTDFDITFSLLNDLNISLSACCEDSANSFSLTFSLINDLSISLSACCENLNDIIDDGFETTFSALDELIDTVTSCCFDITNNFTLTFTLLDDIFNTVTTCCDDLTLTLTTNFDATFTLLSDINTTISECCTDLTATITTDFALTLSLLLEINDTLTSLGIVCSPIAITDPTTITTPGYYCLANDINGTITIAADDVTLDLNNHVINGLGDAISGIVVTSGNNRTIQRGTITNLTNPALTIDTSDNTFIYGVHIINTLTGITAFNSNNLIIENCNTFSSLEGVLINTCSTITIENSIVGHIVTDQEDIDGITILDSINVEINNTTVQQIEGQGQVDGILINGSTNVTLRNTIVQDINTPFDDSSTTGYRITGNSANIKVLNCICKDITATINAAGSTGFFASVDTNFKNCYAANIQSEGSGFFITGANSILTNCIAINCIGLAGFFISTTNAKSLQNCQAYFCTDGYQFSNVGSACVVGNCVAAHNTSDGFEIAIGGTPSLYYCAATLNAGSDYNGVFNYLNNASDTTNAGAGIFAAANLQNI